MLNFINKWFFILCVILYTGFLTVGLSIICLATALLLQDSIAYTWRKLVQEIGVQTFYSRKEWKSLFKC